MKYFRTILLAFVLSAGLSHLAAAQDGAVTGTVIDAATEEPITSATVELRSTADSSLVTGAITQNDGAFQISPVQTGDYYVRVSFVGFSPQIVSDVTLTQQDPEANVGTVALQEDTEQLEEVQVSAEREYMEVGIDKTTYNVQNQPVTAGGSAREVLENIPSIEVDMDGNISLRGSQGVAIYLNGKPAPMSGEALTSFLEGLSADDIARVEVIPNPSASYDPEGMSGIINIVLAKNQELGWGGGVSASAGTRENYNGSANAHYGSGPFNVFANYSLRYEEEEDSGWRWRENRYLNPNTILELDMSGTETDLSNTFNASVDYELSNMNTLSFSTVFSHRSDEGNELDSYTEMDADEDLTGRYNRRTDAENQDFSMDYRLDFQRVITPQEHELSVEARYEEDHEDELERYTQRRLPVDNPDADGTLVERQRVDQGEQEREASLEADYRRPLFDKNAHLEAGYDGEFEWLNNSVYSESLDEATGTLTPDPERTDAFDYAEQTHSLFGVFGGKLGDFGAQLGLRAEQALTTFNQKTLGETFDNSYFSLFPSAHVSYQPTQGNTFKISYSKRVRRPNSWQLNPIADYDDPTFRRIGNPYLTPEYTHSGEVSYSRLGNKYTLTFSPYYRYTVDEISWHEELRDDGVTVLTFENFATSSSYGAELIGSLTLGEWLKGNASVNAYKQVTDASNLSSSLSSDALGFRTRGSLSAELGQGVTLQVSQFYRSPMEIPGGSIGAFTRTNVALQKELLAGRASINLRASDVFDTMGFEIQRDMERYYQEYSREPNSRGLRLSFRYNFGQQDESRRRQDQGGGGGDEGGGGGYGGM